MRTEAFDHPSPFKTFTRPSDFLRLTRTRQDVDYALGEASLGGELCELQGSHRCDLHETQSTVTFNTSANHRQPRKACVAVFHAAVDATPSPPHSSPPHPMSKNGVERQWGYRSAKTTPALSLRQLGKGAERS